MTKALTPINYQVLRGCLLPFLLALALSAAKKRKEAEGMADRELPYFRSLRRAEYN